MTKGFPCHADFPAAHSMDSTWFAVDRDGHVGFFQTGEDGLLPRGAPSLEWLPGPLREFLQAAFPTAELNLTGSLAQLGLFVYDAAEETVPGPYDRTDVP